MAAMQDKMDATQSDATLIENEMTDKQTQNFIQNENKVTDQMKKSYNTGSQQLDKFKRRLIRAVARLKRKKTPEDEMWMELGKEIGCDCKMLWLHMRALTLKKLRRLLPANDLLENITKVAQFTATDWLLFDLILVHENVDVICAVDLEKTDPAKGKLELDKYEEPECMYELFDLVKTHKVEELVGDELTEAWIRITVAYNDRGRQVSPMLLQLRWYQMKELCRAGFYNFWYSYRGNAKFLPVAMAAKPTQLQTRIVQQFSAIVTQDFTSWEKRIQQRRVILSEEFAHTWEKKKKVEKEREEKEIEVIEPQVETIDLDEEESVKNVGSALKSNIDDNNSNHSKESSPNAPDNQVSDISNCIKSVKTEVDDEVLEIDGLSDVEATEIPLEVSNTYENTDNSYENSSDIPIIDNNTVDNITLPTISSVIGNAVDVDKSNSEDEMNSLLKQKAQHLRNTVVPKAIKNENTANTLCDSDSEMEEILHEKASGLMNVEITQIKTECDVEQNVTIPVHNTNVIKSPKKTFDSQTDKIISNNEPIQCDSDDEMNRLLQEKAEQFMFTKESKSTVSKQISSFEENVKNDKFVTEKSSMLLKEDIDKEKERLTLEHKTEEKNNDGIEEINFDDDGIEFVDDGIEFIDDDEQNVDKNINIKKETDSISDTSNENKNENEDEPTIDLKLLMDPIVYTKKIDQMEVFKFTDYYFVNDSRVIDCALLESKPVDKRALKEEDIKKFRDQAMLGYSKEDSQNRGIKEVIEDEDVQRYDTDDSQNHDNEEQSISEESNNKVKSTSWLLQKPKKCSYNPIQLCKNPDFNTRLKRLTAGFLSLSSNRALLKECKPLTIDLHKAFEIKLQNNTLYLNGDSFKSSNATSVTIKNEQHESIISSAMTYQNIINATNSTENISTQTSVQCSNENKESSQLLLKAQEGLLSERRKVINLPDIDQVRRVNQSLLTAEVTPISIDNKSNKTNNTRFQPLSKEPIEKAATLTSAISLNKREAKMPEMDVKNISLLNMESKNVQPHSKSNTDLMADKISDQIIDISNQMSKFDKDPKDKNDSFNTIVNAMSHRFKTNVNKKVEKKTSKYSNYKEPKLAPAKEEMSWMAKYVSNCFADSLLTPDTLNKILFLIRSAEEETKNVEPKSLELSERDPKVKKLETAAKCKKPADCNETTKGQKQKKQKVNRTKELKPDKYKGIFCCWAREKICFLSLKRPLKGHACQKFKCQCCCRHELNKLKLEHNAKNNDKKNMNTIVLSDEEDLTQNIKENSHSHSSIQNSNIQNSSIQNTSIQNSNIQNSVQNSSIHNSENTNPSISRNTSTAEQIEQEPPLVSATSSVSVPENIKAALTFTNTQASFRVTSEPDHDKSLAIVTENGEKTNKLTETINPVPAVILPKIVNTNSEAAIFPKKPIILRKVENNVSKSKCKTVVISAKGHPYNQRLTEDPAEVQPNQDNLIPNISQENTIPLSIRVITPPKQKIHRMIMPKRMLRKPIYIGKNKLLLVSLKKQMPSESPLQLPTLPNGVNFMVLPNGDLTLSIAPGIELNSTTLRALPPIMAVVQDQIKRNKLATSTDNEQTFQKKTHVEQPITYDGTTTLPFSINAIGACLENPLPSMDSQTIDINCQNPVIEINIHQSEQTADAIKNSSNIHSSENISTKDLEHSQTEINTNNHLEKNTEIFQNTLEREGSLVTEGSLPAPDQSAKEVNSKNKNDTPVNSRKSLLSDLMEMSGISAEDTCLVPETNLLPNANTSTMIGIIPPDYIDSGTKPLNDANDSDISIAGPDTNLLLFEPNCPINYLLNCVGVVRPELNAITSFAELKYAYENDGKFYKLDVETGSILPINVMIKKNLKSSIPLITKDVIDLTDDNDITKEDKNTQINNEISNNFSFHDTRKKTAEKKIVVKPLKLFKAVHRSSPSILKRGFRSIIKTNVPVTPVKLLRDKQTQSCKIGDNIITVDLDSESNCSTAEVPPLRYFDNSYDSSDDEPLAKKSKRLKSSATHDDATTKIEPINNKINEEDIAPVPNNTQNGDDTGNASDEEIYNIMDVDIEGVNPELHPVAFEEGSESEDDMCILGV